MGGRHTSTEAADKICNLSRPDSSVKDPVNLARFHIGADDGAYLRQNVMPLQTAIPDPDTELALRLSPELETAGRLGVLEAFKDKLGRDRTAHQKKMTTVHSLLAWTLSIKEVGEYASNFLQMSSDPAVKEAKELLDHLLINTENNDNNNAEAKLNAFLYGKSEPARHLLLQAVVLLFSAPDSIVETMLTRMRTHTRRLGNEIDKMAHAASLSHSVSEANAVQIPDSATVGATGGAAPSASSSPTSPPGTPLSGQNDDDYCSEGGLNKISLKTDAGAGAGLDALCAAQSQLRGDGGVAVLHGNNIVRGNGVSPFWKSGRRPFDRSDDNRHDFWNDLIYGDNSEPSTEGSESATEEMGAIINVMSRRSHLRFYKLSDSTQIDKYPFTFYSMTRGLTTVNPPHLEPGTTYPKDTIQLEYNVPKINFNFSKEMLELCKNVQDTPGKVGDDQLEEKMFAIAPDRYAGFIQDRDLFTFDRDANANISENTEWAHLARWAPVKWNNNEQAWESDLTDTNEQVARAVTLEVVVEQMKHVKKREEEQNVEDGFEQVNLLFDATIAAAKLKQMSSMAVIFSQPPNVRRKLCAAVRTVDNKQSRHFFVQRPVRTCFHFDDTRRYTTLYPCDAGLSSYRTVDRLNDPMPRVRQQEGTPQLANSDAYGRIKEGSDPLVRTAISRSEASLHLRKLLEYGGSSGCSIDANGNDSQNGSEKAAKISVYIAPSESGPQLSSDGGQTYKEALGGGQEYNDALNGFVNAEQTLLNVDKALLPLNPSNKPLDSNQIYCVLRQGISAYEEFKQLECNERHVNALYKDEMQRRKEHCAPDHSDELARMRREAVWNDAQREAAIAGDRLWAFVRQLSGTVSENVDAVCLVDEGFLVRHQAEQQQRRARVAERAAQEHMTLVRNVFTAVLQESGLTLGIGQPDPSGDVGQLKVVSNSLRRTLAQSSQQGNQQEGFFANAVRLEQLLATSPGEMTLTDLFEKLRVAGIELQNAALSVPSASSVGGPSLDFLSAPRNSLVLRYKPEALAAIRQAFDIFQREMLVQHGRMYRTITAYELVEGNNEGLCCSFAQFAAHMLVHSRMYSSATAMYVAAWPAVANAHQLKISLHRLVRVACQYLAFTSSPNFSTEEGRRLYFAQAVSW